MTKQVMSKGRQLIEMVENCVGVKTNVSRMNKAQVGQFLWIGQKVNYDCTLRCMSVLQFCAI